MGRPAPTGPDDGGAEPRPSRRVQRRRELLADIGTVTRDLVVSDGPPAVTMAAVAERLGVTPPALYRYVDGRAGLLDLACAAVARELAGVLTAHRDAAGPDPLARALGVCREFRRWSLAHWAEFSLTFAHRTNRPSPPGTATTPAGEEAAAAELELSWVIEEALLQLWVARPFAVRPDEELTGDLRTSLGHYRHQLRARASHAGVEVEDPPIAAVAVLLEYWTRIYGLVSMEVFGHLRHAVSDGEPLFEAVLAELARLVGEGDVPGTPAPRAP